MHGNGNIPPHSQSYVSVKMRDKQRSIATGARARPNKNNPLSTAILGKQLVKIRDGQTQVLCANQTTRPIQIPKGQKLAVAMATHPYARQPFTMNDYMRDHESYRQYRRTDFEYERAIDKINFAASVLSPKQVQAIKQAIWQERYVLSMDEDIGKLRNYEHEIPMKDLSNFSGRAYRLSPAAREVLHRELEHHESQDIIQPYMSEYNSPCILVEKQPYKNVPISEAKCRLVIDLRQLNKQVEKMKYCLPHVVETISQLEKKSLQYISLVDLTKGF